MTRAVSAAAIAAMLAMGCPPPCPSCVAHPEEPATGAAAATACNDASARVHALGCRTDRPDYVAWCEYEIDHGVPLRPVCVSQAADCAAAEACR